MKTKWYRVELAVYKTVMVEVHKDSDIDPEDVAQEEAKTSGFDSIQENVECVSVEKIKKKDVNFAKKLADTILNLKD